jgi:hypothetical protein
MEGAVVPTVASALHTAYKKDDNAHVEQKNWTHVRKRWAATYDTPQALSAINQLYQELRIFQNLFQPSMKLSCKIRKGSRVIRRYDSSWRCPGL